jgi:hypothetical protein
MIPFVSGEPQDASLVASAIVRTNSMALFYKDKSPLRPRAQASPNMTIAVGASYCESFYYPILFKSMVISLYAGGNTATLTAPSGNPRIDVVYLDSTDVIGVITGTEAASPSIPAIPSTVLPICCIYLPKNCTAIYNFEDHAAHPTQGYIYLDIRPWGQSITSSVSGGSYTIVGATCLAGTVDGNPMGFDGSVWRPTSNSQRHFLTGFAINVSGTTCDIQVIGTLAITGVVKGSIYSLLGTDSLVGTSLQYGSRTIYLGLDTNLAFIVDSEKFFTGHELMQFIGGYTSSTVAGWLYTRLLRAYSICSNCASSYLITYGSVSGATGGFSVLSDPSTSTAYIHLGVFISSSYSLGATPLVLYANVATGVHPNAIAGSLFWHGGAALKTYYKDLSIYNTKTNAWTDKTDSTGTFCAHRLMPFQTDYLFAWRNLGSATERYTISTDAWATKITDSHAVYFVAGCVLEGADIQKAYAVGGINEFNYYNYVDMYDNLTNTISVMSNYPQSFGNASAGSLGAEIVSAAGTDFSYHYSNSYGYNKYTNVWYTLVNAPAVYASRTVNLM